MRARVDHGGLNSFVLRSKPLSQAHFSTLRVFTATSNALVELLKRTKIQVSAISMIFDDYNITFNVFILSILIISNYVFLNTLVASLYSDVFSLILRHGIATLR